MISGICGQKGEIFQGKKPKIFSHDQYQGLKKSYVPCTSSGLYKSKELPFRNEKFEYLVMLY